MSHPVGPHVAGDGARSSSVLLEEHGRWTDANMTFSASSPAYSLHKWSFFISDLNRLPAVPLNVRAVKPPAVR